MIKRIRRWFKFTFSRKTRNRSAAQKKAWARRKNTQGNQMPDTAQSGNERPSQHLTAQVSPAPYNHDHRDRGDPMVKHEQQHPEHDLDTRGNPLKEGT